MSLSYKEMEKYFIQNRVCLKVIAYLTMQCNYHCQHCYETPIKKLSDDLLTADEWIRILAMLRKQGSLYLKLTGGEIFTRKDFEKIYEESYDMGYKITLNTNGSIIDGKHISLLSRKKPEAIYMSVYGASNKTYIRFCGENANYEIVKKNILKLKEAGINLHIKFIANKENIDDLKDVYEFVVTKNHIAFQQYFHITPYVDGNTYPQYLQLEVDELLEKQPLEEWYRLKNEYSQKKVAWENNIKVCTAGLTTLRIDQYGKAFLCDLVEGEHITLNDNFEKVWNMLYLQRKQYIEKPVACNNCVKKEYCGLCAPVIKNAYHVLNAVPRKKCAFDEKMRKSMGVVP